MSKFRILNGAHLILGGVILVLTSCNNSSTTDAAKDSASNVIKDTSVPKPQKFQLVSRELIVDVIKSRIDNSVAATQGRLGDKFPLVTDANGRPVTGFLFDPADFKEVTKANANSLFFRFALKNYKDSAGIAAGTIKPQYTIIVLPVDAKLNVLQDAAGQPIAYDFVCPCPGSACCPVGAP